MNETATPRAYTAEEVRDRLLAHVWATIRYWGGHDGSNVPADRPKDECLSGLAFGILAMLDGCSMELPAIKLVLDPHPDDPEFLRDQGENWYEPGMELEFALHEELYREDLRRDR